MGCPHHVRGPRPASSEALPWWHLFALNHFLEGVQGRCLRRDPWQAGPPARCCRVSGVVAPLYGEKDVKTSPPCGEGSLQEKVSLLPGRYWRTREGLLRWTEPWSAWQGDPARILVSPHGGAHGRHATEALCGGLTEGIITVPISSLSSLKISTGKLLSLINLLIINYFTSS
jgi:hypothetical protein